MELKALNQARKTAFAGLNVGGVQLGLVEGTPHRPSGRLKILTGNYLRALLPEDMEGLPAGALLTVALAAPANPWGLLEARPA
jgi:hypothetical protein